ncbi:hypothetical protein LZ30DRAFT_605178 [Colletotrichum cereale]|nr:hypothetical protein LZ30DRAFT_605178 [Colletotrichum cereale]
MANTIPCFFLAPTWDYPPPPVGPIRLGNVITSIKNPERALFTAPMPDDSGVFSSSQWSVSFSTEMLHENRYGLFTKFLSLFIGAGLDVGMHCEKSNTSLFEFDSLSTTQFLPKQSYLEKCIAAPAVRRYLAKSRYQKPVYIITGLKVVSGAKAKSSRSRAAGAEFQPAVDLTAIGGASVGIGPGVETRREDRKDVAWEGCNDFVFAFRVRKIMVEKRTERVRKNEDYKKGALLDGALKAQDESELKLVLNQEAGAESEGIGGETLTEGEETVICVMVGRESDGEEE